MTKHASLENTLDLSGLVAVVTGAGDGIGRGCAEILAAAGVKVVVSDLSAEKAAETATGITRRGGEAKPVVCNVLNPDDLIALIDFAVNEYGTVNILVNNAGIGGGGRENPFRIDRAYLERVFAINLFAPFDLCRLAAPHMQRSGYGSIVNITSMSSSNASPDMSVYAASKAALNHMSANLAHDYGAMGIRINSVAPGATRTRALASVLTTELEARMLAHTPLRRLGEISDIALAVLFFASPMSAWVSGQVLQVNGGGIQTLDQ